jgi:hypothetical protein
MTINVGSVYNVTVKSGNTASAFSWPSKIPDSGNKYMKNKVIKITKKLNPKDSLDYDYVGDIYDTNDDAIELKNIKIVSKQLILKSSTFPVPGRKKASGKGKKSKKRTKKSRKSRKSRKRSSRKTRRSYIKKTRKRKMKGGASLDKEITLNLILDLDNQIKEAPEPDKMSLQHEMNELVLGLISGHSMTIEQISEHLKKLGWNPPPS